MSNKMSTETYQQYLQQYLEAAQIPDYVLVKSQGFPLYIGSLLWSDVHRSMRWQKRESLRNHKSN